MKKISTLFKKDPNDLGRVINEINPENEWVIDCGIPTRKYDGTSCMIKDGVLYKRHDCRIDKKTGKYEKPIPEGAISCQDPDFKGGHHPHWIKCDRNNPADKYHFIGLDSLEELFNDTYELCGEKVNGNKEKIKGHKLIRHGMMHVALHNYSFDAVKRFLLENDMEGVVIHHPTDGRMCKIRKSDFGIKR